MQVRKEKPHLPNQIFGIVQYCYYNKPQLLLVNPANLCLEVPETNETEKKKKKKGCMLMTWFSLQQVLDPDIARYTGQLTSFLKYKSIGFIRGCITSIKPGTWNSITDTCLGYWTACSLKCSSCAQVQKKQKRFKNEVILLQSFIH